MRVAGLNLQAAKEAEPVEIFQFALATVAITVSMVTAIYVRGQHRTVRTQATRMMQYELIRMAIDKPVLRNVFSEPAEDPDEFTKKTYTNLWFKYLEMGYTTGAISEESLRVTLRTSFFDTENGLAYWERTRDRKTAQARSDRRMRHFVRVGDEEHARARTTT